MASFFVVKLTWTSWCRQEYFFLEKGYSRALLYSAQTTILQILCGLCKLFCLTRPEVGLGGLMTSRRREEELQEGPSTSRVLCSLQIHCTVHIVQSFRAVYGHHIGTPASKHFNSDPLMLEQIQNKKQTFNYIHLPINCPWVMFYLFIFYKGYNYILEWFINARADFLDKFKNKFFNLITYSYIIIFHK